MKNNIYKIALVLGVFLFAFACDEDTFDGDSSAVVASPSLSVSLDFANSQTLVEQEATFGFTVSLSEVQITDVRVNLTQIDGDATEGEDFSFPHTVTIPAGSTSASDVIAIHADDLIEETETAVIKIATGIESNVVAINNVNVTFNIMNLETAELAVGLSWAASSFTTDNSGNEVDPTDLADLILGISSGPNSDNDIAEADGGSFEALTLPASTPNGEYYVVASFYGASDIPADLDLKLTFDQTGIINHQTHEFAGALNTSASCSDIYFVLGKITKAGWDYSFEELAMPQPVDASLFVGSYTELSDTNANDWLTEGVTMVLGDDPNELMVTGIYAGLFDYWGEVFQPGFGTEGDVSIILNADGSVTLPDQYVGQTLPGPYDYYYNGSGSYNLCAKTMTLSFAMQFDDSYSDDYQPATIVIELE